MLDSIRTFLRELTAGSGQARFPADDHRLAAAALLIHAVSVDGDISPVERRRLHDVLQYRFTLDEAATAELIEAATLVDGEAVDLYGFTRLLNRALDAEGRLRIVEMLWELIYADGRVNEFEDNLVWRVADLLGVSARDRISLRQQVAAASGSAAPEPDPD
jgi:uncharacterized tellurite resistance protein B-like protein